MTGRTPAKSGRRIDDGPVKSGDSREAESGVNVPVAARLVAAWSARNLASGSSDLSRVRSYAQSFDERWCQVTVALSQFRRSIARVPWPGLLLAVVVLGLTGAATVAARNANQRATRSELEQRLAEATTVMTSAVSGTTAAIYAGAQWGGSSLSRKEVLRRIHAQAVGGYLPPMLIADISGSAPRVVRRIKGSVEELSSLNKNDLAKMRANVRIGYGGIVRVSSLGGAPKVVAYMPLASGTNVLYTEIDALEALPRRAGELSRSVWFAAYVSPFDIPLTRLASNIGPGRSTKGWAHKTLTFGIISITLAISPRDPLISTFAARVPWVILGVGALLAVALGGVVEALRRRRDHAVDLAVSLEQASRALSVQAFTDSLTGLGNRHVLMKRLSDELRSRESGQVALILIDLDDFKTVNDSLGHVAGDALLVEIGRRLSPEAADVFVRLGGDEFAALVLDENAGPAAERLAHETQRAFQSPFTIEGREIRVRASVGIAVSADATGSPEDLLRNADVAMYSVKGDPRRRVGVFSTQMLESVQARHQLASELARAIDSGEVVARYQPIVDLRDGRIVAFESLARWRHPQRGELAAERFVGLAEEHGIIDALGMHMLAQAISSVARWQLIDPTIQVTVNVSGTHLRDPDFPDRVMSVLDHHAVHPEALVIEVTETVLVQGDGVASNFARLNEFGIRLALDDFGAGFSSFAYLRRMPFAMLKVDRSLVSRPVGPRDSAFLASLVTFAHSQGLPMVAEGVETEAELQVVRDAGFVFGQGYHFRRPLMANQVDVLLSSLVIERAASFESSENDGPACESIHV